MGFDEGVFDMTKKEIAALEDLKSWGVNLVGEFDASFEKATQNSLMVSGHIQLLESPVGEVLALAPAGYRYFKYKMQWYVPSASAMLNQLAMRLVVQAMESRGYSQASPLSFTSARMVSPSGIPTYLIVKYKKPSALVVRRAVETLVANGIENNAQIIIFREEPQRIKSALTITDHLVLVELPPWVSMNW
jgi:hypothetical protein